MPPARPRSRFRCQRLTVVFPGLSAPTYGVSRFARGGTRGRMQRDGQVLFVPGRGRPLTSARGYRTARAFEEFRHI